jgi:hypothetical protein
MSKQKINRFLQSVIAIPMLAMVSPVAGMGSVPNITAIFDKVNTVETSVITTQEEVARTEKAEAIDNFFAKYKAPLEGYGMKFVTEAEKNNIDWRLLPAIAMRESTGGVHACKKATYSVFGYGSCKLNFKSIDESIEIVSKSLGGNNPNTAHHYEGKDTRQILRKYNSVIPNYVNEVVSIMKMIDSKEEI